MPFMRLRLVALVMSFGILLVFNVVLYSQSFDIERGQHSCVGSLYTFPFHFNMNKEVILIVHIFIPFLYMNKEVLVYSSCLHPISIYDYMKKKV